MKNKNKQAILLSFIFASMSQNLQAGGATCPPDISTSFTDYQNMAFRITADAVGDNSLYSQCTDLSSEMLLGPLDSCAPVPSNPINGLGLNPTDKLLYGLSPTDALGIGSHLEVILPFPSPGQPGDIMKADNTDIYKIGNDGGFLDIGSIQPPTETGGLPAGTEQVVPIVHSAASFNSDGDLFVLAYRTNYTSSANVPLGTAEVLYESPQIVIGQIDNTDLTSANGGNIPITWTNITMDSSCDAVLNKFRDDTNVYSVCVVNDYLTSGDEDAAVSNCLVSTPILDKGIHDFAVSPLDDHLYGYDSMTFDDKDVLVDMNPSTNTATCTEIPDPLNTTGVLSSVMFSKDNNLVTIYADQASGGWIDVTNGNKTALPSLVTSAPFSDSSSLPFTGFRRYFHKGTTNSDLVFKNGFEPIVDFIFSNGFEGPGFVSIDLVKSGSFVDTSMDGLAQVGETIDYTFSLSNTGTFDLTNLSITDPLMSVPGTLANLAAATNDNSTFIGSYVLTQADIDNGSVSNIATVHAFDPVNNPLAVLSNGGLPFIVNLPTSSEINLVKSGVFVDTINDGFAQAGETIDYSFTVTNIGNVSLSNLSISDPLMSVSGSLASLAVSASDNSTFSGVYTLTQSDVDNGSVSNMATVNASDPFSNPVIDLSNNGVPLVINLPSSNSISLVKSGVFVDTINDGFAGAGDTINYSFAVTNTGTQTLSNITIADPILSVPGAIPTLAISATDNSTLSATYTLTQADVDNGSVSNLATVNALDPSSNPVNSQSNGGTPLITNLTPSATMTLVKTGSYIDTVSNGTADVGDTINYSFTVTNTGTQTLSNISISDPLVAVPGTLATLAVGASDNITFSAVYTLIQSNVNDAFVENDATVNAEDPSSNPVSALSNGGVTLVTNFTPTASISLVKSGVFGDTSMDGLAQVGEVINYSFVVNNTGSLTLNNVTISDPLMTVPGSIATFNPTATDNSTFSGTYVLTQADIDNGSVSNLATVNAVDTLLNAVNSTSNGGIPLVINLPTSASLSLVKTGIFVDTSLDGLAQVGETIDYSFTVTNTGNLTLTNVSITDPLMSVPGNIATLAVSASDNSTFSGTYVLTQADIDNGSVSNLATVNGSDPSVNNVNAQSNSGVLLTINLPTTASMSLVKTGVFVDTSLDGFAQVGETIDYSFTVTNTGNVTLTNVTITDPLISVPGSIATLAVSASDNSTFTGTYVLTQTDIDNALVSNMATANASDPSMNAVNEQSNSGTQLITNLPIFSCPEF